MSKARLFIPLMQATVRLPHRLLCYITFSISCIMGTYFGLHIEDSITNTRIIGAMTGSPLGGPMVGELTGLTGGLYRHSLGGVTALDCMIPTIVKELPGGLVHSVPVKRGRPDKIFSPLTARAITFVAELVQMMTILLIARPFQGAPHLVQSVATPIMITNTASAALFIRILLGRQAMFEKYTSAFPAAALKVAALTEGILCQGFNEENSVKVAQVLIRELDVDVVTTTDRDKLLAFTGIGDDHHLPGKLIPSSYMQWAIETGKVIYVNGNEIPYRCSTYPHCKLGSTLVIPLRGENQRAVGTIRLYEARNRLFSLISHTLEEGIAQLLSMQILARQYKRQKALLAQFEIKLLYAQVDPYSLFDALNTLRAVIHRDSDQADQPMQYLSAFSRKNLRRPMEVVTPADEIEHVNACLQIEKARSQANLQIQTAVLEGLTYHQLLTFALQPIAENAIKHDIPQHPGIGEITVRVDQDDRWLQLDTEGNTGLYWANPQVGGLGMDLVDRRLWTRFGADCGTSVTYKPERFTRVTLCPPLEENTC